MTTLIALVATVEKCITTHFAVSVKVWKAANLTHTSLSWKVVSRKIHLHSIVSGFKKNIWVKEHSERRPRLRSLFHYLKIALLQLLLAVFPNTLHRNLEIFYIVTSQNTIMFPNLWICLVQKLSSFKPLVRKMRIYFRAKLYPRRHYFLVKHGSCIYEYTYKSKVLNKFSFS